jgi:hypothetical protein
MKKKIWGVIAFAGGVIGFYLSMFLIFGYLTGFP